MNLAKQINLNNEKISGYFKPKHKEQAESNNYYFWKKLSITDS